MNRKSVFTTVHSNNSQTEVNLHTTEVYAWNGIIIILKRSEHTHTHMFTYSTFDLQLGEFN